MSKELSSAEAMGCLLTGAFFLVGTTAFAWIAQSAIGASVALALAVAFVLGSIVYAVRRLNRVTDVRLDEGGLRVSPRNGESCHLSFSELKSATLARSFGRVALRLGTTAGTREYLLESAGDELQAQLETGIREAAAQRPTGVEELARNGQPLDAWLERLRDTATPDYRARPVDPEALVAVIEDRAAPVELRAAAAHVLVWLRDHEKATRVMAVLGRSTPPLVVVAAALATKHGTYVAEYEEAVSFLSPADRAVAARMMEDRPMKLRVDTSAELEEEEAEAEAEHEREART